MKFSSTFSLICVALATLIIGAFYHGSGRAFQYHGIVDVTANIRSISRRLTNPDNKEAPYNSPNLTADDPIVVKALKDLYLEPPPQLPYNLIHSDPEYNPSKGQAQLIDKLLQQKEGGFYIESGAYDGESYSNSLIFERLRGWNGLLIEPSEDNFAKLKTKNRKAYISNTCLSNKHHAQEMLFAKHFTSGRVVPSSELISGGYDEITHALQQTQCFPLYSYLLALNQTKIDYFSLDVEGSEYGVLKNIPWDKVDISMLSVEILVQETPREEIKKLMEDNGYTLHSIVTSPFFMAGDYIFVKNAIYNKLSL